MFAYFAEIVATFCGLVLLALVFLVGELWHALRGRSGAGRGRAFAFFAVLVLANVLIIALLAK